MAITIENEGILITECSHVLPHEAHSWRTGFLWRHKNTCSGLTKEQAERFRNVITHRHQFRFAPVHSDHIMMTWRCKKSGCRESMCMLRSAYNHETLGHPLDWFISQWNR